MLFFCLLTLCDLRKDQTQSRQDYRGDDIQRKGKRIQGSYF